MRKALVVLAAVIIIAGLGVYIAVSGGETKLQESAAVGPSPTIPEPDRRLIPTINIAPAKAWPSGEKPTAAAGLSVEAWAVGLDHPRWLWPKRMPPRIGPRKARGSRASYSGWRRKRAGGGVPSPDRIVLLRGAGNGSVTKTTFLENLHSPFGMALVGNDFYVANTDAVVRFPYTEGATHIDAPGEKVADLPAGPINHHWTKK